MDKKADLHKFLTQKIRQIDESMSKETEDIARLKLATLRTSYAKMMQNFLKSKEQLPKSHLEQAKIYLKNGKMQQAICQAQQAKRKIEPINKGQNSYTLSEDIDLLLVECYLQSKKSEDALSIIEEIDIKSEENKEKYLTLKGKIYEAFNNQLKAKENYDMLYQLVIQKYGKGTLKEGQCLIQMGKNLGYFKHQKQGINLMNQGMDILISQRYHNADYVAEVYETLAELNKEIEDFQKEYSSLICAFSMIKQLQENQEKRNIEVLNKLATNLIKRDEKQKALDFLLQVEQIERKIYGQSSNSLIKTVNKIIALLSELNKITELRKYQIEYDHLIEVCRIAPSSLNMSTAHSKTMMVTPSSIQRQKNAPFSNSRVGSAKPGALSRVIS